jgi:hypothetical protein
MPMTTAEQRAREAGKYIGAQESAQIIAGASLDDVRAHFHAQVQQVLAANAPHRTRVAFLIGRGEGMADGLGNKQSNIVKAIKDEARILQQMLDSLELPVADRPIKPASTPNTAIWSNPPKPRTVKEAVSDILRRYSIGSASRMVMNSLLRMRGLLGSDASGTAPAATQADVATPPAALRKRQKMPKERLRPRKKSKSPNRFQRKLLKMPPKGQRRSLRR